MFVTCLFASINSGVLKQLLGAYSFFLESLDEVAEDVVNGTKVDSQALIQENKELRESLEHLRTKYQDLMAYMKERCYADDGERSCQHINFRLTIYQQHKNRPDYPPLQCAPEQRRSCTPEPPLFDLPDDNQHTREHGHEQAKAHELALPDGAGRV
jgi:hypothetical protein